MQSVQDFYRRLLGSPYVTGKAKCLGNLGIRVVVDEGNLAGGLPADDHFQIVSAVISSHDLFSRRECIVVLLIGIALGQCRYLGRIELKYEVSRIHAEKCTTSTLPKA